MQTKVFMILTVNEAKEALVQHFTDFLVNNRDNLAFLLREGKLDDLPDFSTITESQVIQLYRENKLGDSLQCGVDSVAIVTSQNVLEIVHDNPVKEVNANFFQFDNAIS